VISRVRNDDLHMRFGAKYLENGWR